MVFLQPAETTTKKKRQQRATIVLKAMVSGHKRDRKHAREVGQAEDERKRRTKKKKKVEVEVSGPGLQTTSEKH